MARCETCGKDGEMFKALVEGTELVVCRSCAAFGTILRRIQSGEHEAKNMKKPSAAKAALPEAEEVLVGDYAQQVRRKREQLGLTQEELAKNVAEKVSLIHKIEGSQFSMPLSMARKFERVLGIRLVEEVSSGSHVEKSALKPGPLTIGDMIKVKSYK